MGRIGKALTSETGVRYFKDHTNNTYTIVGGRPSFCPDPDVIRKLSVHLYCLNKPEPGPEAFGKALYNTDIFGLDKRPRIDVYTNCTTIDECMTHHLREKQHRRIATEEFRRNAVEGMTEEEAYEHLTTKIRGLQPLPHIVPSWCSGPAFWNERFSTDPHDRYRSFILVLDENIKNVADMLEKGIKLVEFDLSWTTAMETSIIDYEPEPSNLENDHRQPWLYVEQVPKPPETKTRLLCVRPEPYRPVDPNNSWINPDGTFNLAKYNEYQHGWKTPGTQGTLRDMWSQKFSMFLNDCTYGNTSCDGCRAWNDRGESEGIVHRKEDCEWELEEHFFDDDGQCVECRRFIEYRRRSKRLAQKRKATDMD